MVQILILSCFLQEPGHHTMCKLPSMGTPFLRQIKFKNNGATLKKSGNSTSMCVEFFLTEIYIIVKQSR
jgi:hypothetical protein